MSSECIAHTVEVIRASLDCGKLQYCAKTDLSDTKGYTHLPFKNLFSKYFVDLTAFSPLTL